LTKEQQKAYSITTEEIGKNWEAEVRRKFPTSTFYLLA
jgi:hypothetical protein